MFTGLVERQGKVVSADTNIGGMARLGVDTGLDAARVRKGNSIAVNGVCLTVTDLERGTAFFDVMRKTLEHSNLSGIAPGRTVNIETALCSGDSIGGHFVTGHIDGTRPVRDLHDGPGELSLDIAAGPDDLRFLIARGSVAIDGVSLTVSEVRQEGSFSVNIIPHTARETTLGLLRRGDRVNVEFDILAKYVAAATAREGVTLDKLKNAGFTNETERSIR